MLTTELKNKIIAALAAERENFGGTDAKFAVSIGISGAQYSRVKNGDTNKVLSPAVWIGLARRLNVSLSNEPAWVVVETPVFKFIVSQLTLCQKAGTGRLLCDIADLGKTEAAKWYIKNHPFAVRIDCSQVKTKQKLVREIAKSFGVGHAGKYSEVYADLVFYLRSLPSPLIIIDEAGDLDYGAFLELKALWNATEQACGWYMMGADGLKAKMERCLSNKKVGYAEIFSRYGSRYMQVTPEGGRERHDFIAENAAMIAKANAPQGTDILALVRAAESSPRRVRDILKLQKTA